MRPTERQDQAHARCAYCQDVLGIYEPIMVIVGDRPAHRTSLAAEELPAECVAMHEGCFREQAQG